MNINTKRHISLAALIAILVAGIVAVYAARAQDGSQAPAQEGPVTRVSPVPSEPPKEDPKSAIPDHAFYALVFRSIVILKNVGDYQNAAGLTDEEAVALKQTVEDCQREIALVEAKAQKIVGAFREKMRNRKPGEPWPARSTELKELEKQRTEIILRYRDQLRQTLGDEKFASFNQAANNIVHIKKIMPGS